VADLDSCPSPRSLGVIGGTDFTARAVLSSYDATTINAATYAVTSSRPADRRTAKPSSTPIFTGQADRDGATGRPRRHADLRR